MDSQIQIQNYSSIVEKIDLSEPYTWVAPDRVKKEKGSFDFDAIVVGAGLGGLACAALLAKHTFKVLVLEQHYQVGGYCSSFKRDGFTFTSGVEDVSGVDEGGIRHLLDELDLKREDLFVLNTRLFVVGGKRIILDGTKEGTIGGLSAVFPHEKAAIALFIDEVDRALKHDAEVLKNWGLLTYQQKLDEVFHDEELKLFFCSLLGYMGVRAEDVPASAVLGACLSYFVFGGYYPKGGPQHFSDTLCAYITAHGGTLMTKTSVDEIQAANGEVSGVRVGDRIYSSPIVVANVNAKTLFTKLVPEGKVQKAYVDAIARLPMSISVCMVQVGTDLDLSHLPSHIQVLDQQGRCHGVINSNADSSLAPKGKSSITFLSKGDYRDTPPRLTADYARYKKEKAEIVLARAERLIPHLCEHICVQDVSTPRTFERYTSMPEGAIYAFAETEKTRRPYFKTPLRGLYLASASTSGGGVESVVDAGRKCAEDILC